MACSSSNPIMATRFSSSLVFFLLLLFAIPHIHADSINIDCGATESYLDGNGKWWVPDGDYVKGGEDRTIEGDYNQVMNTLKLFKATRSCYTIGITKGQRVMVRASFKYGNYDGRSSPPTFDIYLEGSMWNTVQPTNDVSFHTFSEVIYVPQSDAVSVCLVQTKANNFPFISALEVIGFESDMYNKVDKNQALANLMRSDYGGENDVEYPDDTYDRVWLATPADSSQTNVTSDTMVMFNTPADRPPESVVQTGITSSNASESLDLGTITAAKDAYYIAMYFTEMSVLSSTDKRSFIISIGNKNFSNPIVPPYQRTLEMLITNVTTTANVSIALVPTSDSTLPPIISAAEVYRVFTVTTLPSSGGGGSGGGGGSSGGSSDDGDTGSSSSCVDCTPTSSSKKSNKLPAILGSVIPIGVIFWAIVGFCIIRSKRRRAAITAMSGAQGRPNGQAMSMGAMGKPPAMNGGVPIHDNGPAIEVNLDMGDSQSTQQQGDFTDHNNNNNV